MFACQLMSMPVDVPNQKKIAMKVSAHSRYHLRTHEHMVAGTNLSRYFRLERWIEHTCARWHDEGELSRGRQHNDTLGGGQRLLQGERAVADPIALCCVVLYGWIWPRSDVHTSERGGLGSECHRHRTRDAQVNRLPEANVVNLVRGALRGLEPTAFVL